MNIFEPRVAFKPFEYPHLTGFKDAINHSYWLVSEWNFTSDVQDFYTRLSPEEREIIRKTLLAISQIEIAVKRFWVSIGTRMPKAEIDQVGISFGESEIRHADAYSHLLEVLGLNGDFVAVLQEPSILGRMEYLTKYIKDPGGPENFSLTLTLFSLLVENVSLFSQFLIIKSFSSSRNMLKDIDNVIQATIREEQLHAMFGAELINIIRSENPGWFGESFYEKLYKVCDKAYLAESRIIDWIFSEGTLPYLPVDVVKEFVRHRINEGLSMIGAPHLYTVDDEKLSPIRWFNDELYADVSTDFFYKKSTAYSKKTKAFTAEDLF